MKLSSWLLLFATVGPANSWAAGPTGCQRFVDHVITSVNALTDHPKSQVPPRKDIATSHDPSWLYQPDTVALPFIRIWPNSRGYKFPQIETTGSDDGGWMLTLRISNSKTYQYKFNGFCHLQKVEINESGPKTCDHFESKWANDMQARAHEACDIGQPFFIKAHAPRLADPAPPVHGGTAGGA